MIIILQLNIFNAPRTSQQLTLNNFHSYMAFKMKIKGIEGDGEGSLVRDTSWRGWVLVPNEGELENRNILFHPWFFML